jgi:outer membrane receptor protein involved in Fe transport
MKTRITLFIVVLSFFGFIANAQKQTIVGKIVNAENGKPLSNATITIQPILKTTQSDFDGNFSVAVPVGEYSIQVALQGYEIKVYVSNLVLKANETKDVNIGLISSEIKVSTVRTPKRETVAGIISAIKNNSTISSGISQAQIRSLPIRTAADALKTVSGITIQENKYVIIRGLADRYNMATLNGALLSSTEPDRKTFGFDVFPSNIIDNIIVNKAALPELPGEFGGGLIQIQTKDIADKSFLTASLSTGFNTQTHNTDFYRYQGGSLDFLGLDDGNRKLPSNFPTEAQVKTRLSTGQKAELSTMLNENWNYSPQNAPLNSNLQISGAYTKALQKNRKFGVVANAMHNQQFRKTNINKAFYEGGNFEKFNFNDGQFSRNLLVGGLLNASYQTKQSKISWKNTYNIISSDATILRTGLDNGSGTNVPVKSYLLMFKSNRLMNTQLIGEHKVLKNKYRIKWNANAARLFQDIPDMKNLAFDDADRNGTYIANIPQFSGNARSAGRFFSKLDDIIAGGSLDIARSFKIKDLEQTIKIGGLYQYKNRQFRSRVLGIIAGSNNLPELLLGPDKIFNLTNFSSTKFHYDELTTASNQYDAIGNNYSGYVQIDNNITNRLKASWGVRIEDFSQVLTFKSINRTKENVSTDILPSANFTYALNKKTNLRLSASKTLARPEFRELSIFSFYDFERNALIFGNENLKNTKIYNFDAKYEFYPASGEVVSVGAFYKYFKNPIEASTDFNAGSPVYSFVNADHANNFGIELDARKKLNFINGNLFKNITLFTNLALISSEASFGGAAATTNTNRAMQGQSNYVVNVGFSYEEAKRGVTANVYVNRIGRRIAFVGNDVFLPIWENPRTNIDMQVSKKLFKNKMEIKLTVSDLLNQKSIFYQDLNKDKKYNATSDKAFYNYRFGTNMSFGFSYNFL